MNPDGALQEYGKDQSRELESEGSERNQGGDGDKLVSMIQQVWPGKGERTNYGCPTAPSYLDVRGLSDREQTHRAELCQW